MPRKPRPEQAPAPRPKTAVRPIVIGLAVVLAAVIGAGLLLRTPPFALTPNAERSILLVTIDTLRADAVGSYGGRATTPNLDRLAARGARFTFAHSHAVVTLPSHASILAGRYPYEHGIRDNTGYRFPAAMPTAATALKARGFATGAFIGGFPLDRRFGLNAGFDVYDDRLGAATDESGERERRADVVVSSALDWIGRQQGPWFAWVHLYDPHVTYAAPQEWASRFPSDPYLAEVSWMDAALGPLFERLATQTRPTLVIATSDHGEGLGDHGEKTHSIFAYESTLHVPLVIGEVAAGSPARRGVTVETPVRHVDLLPTVLEAAAAPALPNLPGASLAELIARGSGPDRPSYFEAMSATVARGWAPLRGVLVDRDKYIDLPIAELYDVASDPKELRNDVSTRADRVRVLQNVLKSFNTAPPGRPGVETPETRERLRSLGYIGGGSAATRDTYTEADDPKRLIELEQAIQRAMEAYQQGRAEEAVAALRDVIAKRPDTEDAYRRLALIYWRAGNARAAIATLEEALRRGITQSEVKIKLGQYLALAGQPARAIALLETFTEVDPDALIALGNAYLAAGRRADAIKTFRRLLDADPKNGLAHENIGVAHLQAREYGPAETELRLALDLDPRLAGANTALGVVLAATGRRDEAIDAWKRAVDVDQTELNALFNLTVNLAAAGRGAEARQYGERFLAAAPPAMPDRDQIRKILDAIR